MFLTEIFSLEGALVCRLQLKSVYIETIKLWHCFIISSAVNKSKIKSSDLLPNSSDEGRSVRKHNTLQNNILVLVLSFINNLHILLLVQSKVKCIF
jgi:hypothetical protein